MVRTRKACVAGEVREKEGQEELRLARLVEVSRPGRAFGL